MELPETSQITYRDVLKILDLLVIPAVLTAIYYGTSLSFQQTLVLDHTNPRLPNFWTNALVHDHRPSDGHLIGNLVGYLLLVFPCWILQIYCEQERHFWLGLGIILAISPFIISASSYLAFYEILGFEIQNDRGFSGVVSALAGFLLMSILHTFTQKQREPVAVLSMGLYFGYLMLGFGILTERIVVVSMGVFVLVVMFAGTRTSYVASAAKLSEWGNKNGRLSLVLLVSILVSVLGFTASLPSDITSGGGLTNIVAHGVGILFGMAVAGSLRYHYKRSSSEESAAD